MDTFEGYIYVRSVLIESDHKPLESIRRISSGLFVLLACLLDEALLLWLSLWLDKLTTHLLRLCGPCDAHLST